VRDEFICRLQARSIDTQSCCSRSIPLLCSEVNIYIEVPKGVGAKDLAVTIGRTHLAVGIKGNPPYLDVRPVAHCSS